MQHELQDVPFDPGAGEVVCVSRIADAPRLPAYTLQLTLLAVDSSGVREGSTRRMCRMAGTAAC